ncbi:hypothetical protein ACFUC1_19650 [Pedococcus sp. NPDC057267]|uniref:hypothetical protein n=1 Tax=Pedococcus sp. NPDC057267 TaxID=3346077 RepID=UPI00362AD6D2
MIGVILGWGLVAIGIILFLFPLRTAKRRAELSPIWLSLPLVALQIWAGDTSGSTGNPVPLWVLLVDGAIVILIGTIGHVRFQRSSTEPDGGSETSR